VKLSVRAAAACITFRLAFFLVPLSPAFTQNPPIKPEVHVTTNLVQIGVIVRDRNGPVTDLTVNDFRILDRGKPRNISIFSTATAESPQSARVLPPNTFSDSPQYGAEKLRSVTIVLLDNLNTLSASAPLPYEDTPFWVEDHALANAKQRLLEFLKHQDPSGRIAIYGLSRSLHVLCDFTCDRDQLLAVVSRYDARSVTQRDAAEVGTIHLPNQPPSSPHAFEDPMNENAEEFAGMNNEARAEATMSALVAIAAHVADIPGRKNLLWLTANLPFSGHAIARILQPVNIAAYPIDARGLLPRAPQGNITGVIDADDYALGKLGPPSAMSPQPVGIKTMEEMASDTGGEAFVNSNDLATPIRKVVEDSEITYTLGFYIESSSLDDKFHELKVQVKRPGLDVHYPKGYFGARDLPATQNESHNAFLAAIRSPLEAANIPLDVRVDHTEQPQPHSLQVLGVVGVKNLRLPEQDGIRTGMIDVYAIQQDITGKVLQQVNERFRLRLTEQQYQTYLQSGIKFREIIQPNPQTVTLRVLVQDPGSSEVGSVIIPLSRVN
jgi:VWFA-related protein